jgi:hypothetical protein
MTYVRLAILAGLIALGWAVYDFVAEARDRVQRLTDDNLYLLLHSDRMEQENARQNDLIRELRGDS